MISRLRRWFSTTLVFLVAAMVATSAPAPGVSSPPVVQAQETMPDGLMSAFLEASSQPFTLDADGYHARSGGLDVTLDTSGLQATVGGFAWHLSLRALGREGQIIPLPQAQIVRADDRLEYRRGALTEWYCDTALGVEQGFTIHQPPRGAGALVLQLELSTELPGAPDADGRGLSFAAPDGHALRYDHLRAWDAHGALLEAQLTYTPGQVMLQVNDREALYPVTIDPFVYQEWKIVAPDGANNNHFGYSVALSGDTALIGAPFDDVGANRWQGSAYVFARSGTAWSLQAHLTAADRAAFDQFGWSVALWGDTALVGAIYDDVGANVDQGSVYVFTRSGTMWSQRQKLIAPDGAVEDGFGVAVAVWEDTALVGAHKDHVSSDWDRGSAYVFTRSGETWTQQAHLITSDGAWGDFFGWSVALWGNTALVGAAYDDIGANVDQGSAYVFVRSGTTWSEQAHLTASDGLASDRFGQSVALWGDTALVGVPADRVGVNSVQGSAYVFSRSGTTWSEQAHLIALDGLASDFFGQSVALWGDTALVGAPGDDVGANYSQGSAYMFTRSGTTWSEQGHLSASDGSKWDQFGWSVALSGDTALVGAVDDAVGTNSAQGSAYLYDVLPVIASIGRADADPTSTSRVRFTVAFSKNVTSVDGSDFLPSVTGSISDAQVTAVSGGGPAYTVTVSTGTGSGTLRLDVPSTATITDLAGNPLSGLPYTGGETYTVDKAAPTVLSITRADPDRTRASNVRFGVTFSEDVTGVDASDFVPNVAGSISGAEITAASGTGATYTITVLAGTGCGTLGLAIPPGATITDLAGNPLSGLPYTSDEAYTFRYMTYLPLTLRAWP